MQDNKVNRLNELNKLWFRLHVPKQGDKVKFKIKGFDEIHEAQISKVEKDANNRIRYQMISKTASPLNGMQNIQIVEINGVKFEELQNPNDDFNNFKPV